MLLNTGIVENELYRAERTHANVKIDRADMSKIIAAAFACAILFVPPARAAACHKTGETVTMTGTIHMRVLPPDARGSATRLRTRPTMQFDEPICVDGGELGTVANGKAAAIVLLGVEQTLVEGQHISLQGQLSPRPDMNWPEELILTIADMAPDAPGPDEKPISGASDAIAENCARSQARMAKSLHQTILKVRITHSPRYGTIWRADTAFPLDGGRRYVSRTVCWKGMEVDRPLDMFDTSKSIPPLQ